MDLKSFFTAHWEYLAVKTACEMNIFDFIEQGSFSLTSLAAKGKFDGNFLHFLLQALHHSNFICYENEIKLTENGRILTENHPKSLKYACILWAEEHLAAWQNLSFSLKIGKPYFEMQGEKDYFGYIENNDNEFQIYHKAMYEYARDDYEKLPQLIDFSIHKAIIDVGGGLGALIEGIAKSYPQIKCYLFDKEEVVDLAEDSIYEKLSGDFFYKLPKTADALILSRVIHDWNDENALLILKNCYDALPTNGKLYLIENEIDNKDFRFSLLNLNMKLMTSGRERKLSEYQDLAQRQGFVFEKSVALNDLQIVLIFYKK